MEKAVWIFVVANGGRKEQMAVRRSGRSIKKNASRQLQAIPR
jgi:hypothetical protein